MTERPWSRMGEHDGPCLNYEGQKPENYDEYDSCYLHIQASDRWHERIYGIVQAVAEADPVLYEGDPAFGDYICVLCKQLMGGEVRYHDSGCPWRSAVEFVSSMSNEQEHST